MPIEIHEVDVLPPAAPKTPAPNPPTLPPTPAPMERGEQLRRWQGELAGRAARLRAD